MCPYIFPISIIMIATFNVSLDISNGHYPESARSPAPLLSVLHPAFQVGWVKCCLFTSTWVSVQ